MTTTSASSNSITQSSSRAERTPGMAAVSLYEAGGPGFPGPSPFPASVVGQIPGVQGTESPRYLDCIAKRSAGDLAHLVKRCPGYFLVGGCEHGHRYAKELYCGREWCPVCGEDWSAVHKRRFARWGSKAMQMKGLGYYVFTIPPELRDHYRKRVRAGQVKVLVNGVWKGKWKPKMVHPLAGLGRDVQKLLKSRGYPRGLRRWHFFGDKSSKYNPHLNVLVDGGRISKRQLRVIKREYAALLGVGMAVVHYEYRQTPGEMVHTLKYVLRSTFRDWRWDVELAHDLSGFRNQLWWGSGRWDGEPSWSMGDIEGADVQDVDILAVESLESGLCPQCDKPLSWSRALPMSVLESMERRSLGAGYYELESESELAARAPPGLSLEVIARLEWVRLGRLQDLDLAREKYLVDLQEEWACDLAYFDAVERGEL